jgi:hypothetical protein
MKVELISNKFSPGQRAIIDKGNPGGRHVKLADGESMIYIESDTHCIVRERLFGTRVIVELTNGGWRCEIDSLNLTRAYSRSPMQTIDLYSLTGIVDEEG